MIKSKPLFRIKRHLSRRTAIVGIGNMLKGDDSLGPVLVSRLQGKTKACLFDCGQVPENYIQPIIESRPETIIIVDAADWGARAGELRLISNEELAGIGFSTHNAALRVFVDYLKSQLPLANIIIIGVQAGRRDLMQPLTPEVEETLNELVNFFASH